MKPDKLRALIDSLLEDIEFQYKGIWGSICPFARDDISLCYNGKEVTVDSIDKAMTTPFVGGHSLDEVANELQFGYIG